MGVDRLLPAAVFTFLDPGQRPGQEDAALGLREKGIFVVADGFGGPLPGAAAAKEASEAIRHFLIKEAGDEEATLPFVLRSYFSLAGNVLFNALIHANRKVLALNQGKGVHEKGGSSVLAGFLDGDLLALANVGCCSAWLLRDGLCRELVVPRTYGRLVEPFDDEVPEPLQVPLMALGISEDLEPEVFEYRLRPGDWLVFHTDGLPVALLHRFVTLQRSGRPASEAVEEVKSLLGEEKYKDNCGVTLAIF